MFLGAEIIQGSMRSAEALLWGAQKIIQFSEWLRYRSETKDTLSQYSESDVRETISLMRMESRYVFDSIVGNPAVTDGLIASQDYKVPDHLINDSEESH